MGVVPLSRWSLSNHLEGMSGQVPKFPRHTYPIKPLLSSMVHVTRGCAASKHKGVEKSLESLHFWLSDGCRLISWMAKDANGCTWKYFKIWYFNKSSNHAQVSFTRLQILLMPLPLDTSTSTAPALAAKCMAVAPVSCTGQAKVSTFKRQIFDDWDWIHPETWAIWCWYSPRRIRKNHFICSFLECHLYNRVVLWLWGAEISRLPGIIIEAWTHVCVMLKKHPAHLKHIN